MLQGYARSYAGDSGTRCKPGFAHIPLSLFLTWQGLGTPWRWACLSAFLGAPTLQALPSLRKKGPACPQWGLSPGKLARAGQGRAGEPA